MYDDIANSRDNPRPGVIINKPDGEDVYKGVPKVCVLSQGFWFLVDCRKAIIPFHLPN